MKSAVFSQYGNPDVIRIVEKAKPQIKKDEVLVKVVCSSVQAADWRIRSMNLPPGMNLFGRLAFGMFRPRLQVLGTELSGIIEQVGSEVSEYKVGDAVVALMGAKMGAHSEYVTIHAKKGLLTKKPKSLSFCESAVACFGAITAYDFLENKSSLKKGDQVLIHGASGPVGLAAIQIAKKAGAKVTAVCSSKNFELVTQLGADKNLDYKEKDFRELPQKFDLILDVTGKLSAKNSFGSLKPQGKLLLISAGLGQMLSSFFSNLVSSKKVVVGVALENKDNLKKVLREIEEKKLIVTIDKVFSLDRIAEAHAYVEKRHRSGNVAIQVAKEET